MKLLNLPNTLTCCNLISGCVATTVAILSPFTRNMEMALLFIIIGALFDFCDGLSARLTHVSSPVGKELDSLADVVTFGVAPSAMVFSMLQETFNRYLSLHSYTDNMGAGMLSVIPMLAFVMAAFSALRLAKFNLDTRQTTSFIGLPTPANALFWASIVVGFGSDIVGYGIKAIVVTLLMVAVSCWLLISEIPMFALKFKHYKWKGNEVKYIFIVLALALIALLCEKAFAPVIALYVLMSVIYRPACQCSHH